MNRIGLKINGIWCVLPQDVSISIEEQNPLFSDSGSFSYPIEMSVSQNRELFKSIDHPHGVIRPQDLDGLPFELWYDGTMLLYGSTETDEDLDIDEDKCSINLVSGNGDFQSKIDGLQCTDVPLLDEIYIGDVYTDCKFYGGEEDDKFDQDWHTAAFNEACNMDFKAANVSDPFPVKPYCNIRLCVKKKEEWGNAWEKVYYVLEADRPWSGMCFYVGYFLKCLFAHLGFAVKDDHLQDVEDMKRLAFVTTKCEHKLGDEQKLTGVKSVKAGKYVDLTIDDSDDATISDVRINKRAVYATEKNFPETDVSQVVESLFNAFGLKIIANADDNSVSLYYMRDILRDNDVIDVQMKVTEMQITYSKVKGVRMTYGGDDDDTAFNYNEWNGQISVVSDYKKLIRSISAYDKTLYVNPKTGNKYRIKIDGDAEKEGDEKNLNPSLFEVSQFSDYVIGEDTEDTEDLEIGFTPLIENDIAFGLQRSFNQENTQCLALYVDGAEVNKPDYVYTRIDGGSHGFGGWGDWELKLKEYRYMNFDADGENPITSHDCGFMLGVMRGPGSKSGYAVQIEDYDGNGNDAWVTVEDDYAFTSDSIDAYGNHYDYNGDTDGGVVGLEDTISLKTHIQTAQDLGLKDKDGNAIDWGINAQAAKRGLADRFMSEYMYFLLHRKTVSMDVDTTLSQLTSLSWFKQLRISDTVGRLKSRKYTLTNSGVSDMSIELYTIN